MRVRNSSGKVLASTNRKRCSQYSRVERTVVAITADLKTKDLAQRGEPSLLCSSFMKFRGPEALKDKLLITALIIQVEGGAPKFPTTPFRVPDVDGARARDAKKLCAKVKPA